MKTVLDAIIDQRWAMTPQALSMIFQIIDNHASSSPEAVAKFMEAETERMKAFHASGQTYEEAIEKVRGDALNDQNSRVRLRGSVALIPILGPIFPRANLFTQFSGATSIEQLALDFNAAMEDDRVETIIHLIDSPGGVITGISEFSETVFNARSEKRIISFVTGMAASAALWIGTAASRVVLTDTSEIGSLGVVAISRSDKARNEKIGIKDIEIISSQSPNKRPDPETDAGRSQIQGIVDELAEVFIEKVALHRGVSADEVKTQFGQGAMFVAGTAIQRGIADSIGGLEALIDEENENSNAQPISGGLFMSDKTKKELEDRATHTMTVEAIRESSPEAYAKIFQSGKDEGIKHGAKEENARIKNIEELTSLPGAQAVVGEHKFNMEMNKDSVATKVLESQKATADAKAEALKKDGKDVAGKVQGGESGQDDGVATKEEDKSAVASMVAGADR